MASGVPVVSTPCGIARDIGKPRENMMIVPFGEYEVLRDSIKEILDSPSFGNELRQTGWRTIKNFSDGVMARAYSDVFYDLLAGSLKPWVSVIIPSTYDRADQVKEILKALEAQTYPNIEALVIWDGESSDGAKMRLEATFPLRELHVGKSGYNLAHARNLGVTEACGEVIVLCDSRFTPLPTGIAEFVKKLDDHRPEDKIWLFGDKIVKGLPAGKKTFVENWSCISRKQLIEAGMFDERISEYGGMSQELRGRFMAQGFELVYLPEAKANEILKSGSRNLERRQSMIRMKELLFKLGFN
jgi:GT2 family glycosyltransferase